ncbi:three component ABC system middle component [Cryobacterium sinapicolor]|uniref:three component ABC system middle component n=1 Tax=Cryobacterium sinapicolor TaxID=1259236 RepID=UPI003B9798A2
MRRPSSFESREVAALFNPAVIALVLIRSVSAGHDAHTNTKTVAGLPLVYAPMVAALALYPDLRATLSMTISTQFGTWLERSAAARIFMPERVRSLVPLVNEGLLFALANDVLVLQDGILVPGSAGPKKATSGKSADIVAAQKGAAYLGRWLPNCGTPAAVCARLGITP